MSGIGDVATVSDGPVLQVESVTGDVATVSDGPVQQVESVTGDVVTVSDGPVLQVESVMGDNDKFPEPEVEELRQDILADCIASDDGKLNTCTAMIREQLETKDDIVPDRQTDPTAQDDSKLDTDAALEKDSTAEIQMTCHQNTSITQCKIAEQTENESSGVDKLSDNTELDTPETGMSDKTNVCTDAEMKTHSDSVAQMSSSHHGAVELPVVTVETGLNSVPEYIVVMSSDKDKELVHESDNRALCAELTCVSNVDAEAAVDVSNEHFLSSEVDADPEQQTRDLPGTKVTSESEYTVVKCGEESELVDECDKPVNCARNVNIEAPVDVSNETVLSEANADHVRANTEENSKSECFANKSDKDSKIVDESGKRVSYSEVKCVGNVHAEVPDEVLNECVSSVADVDTVHATETSENVMERPDALLLLLPSVNASDQDSMMKTGSVRVENLQVVETCSKIDRETETEVCCTEGEEQCSIVDSLMEHDGELLEQPETVAPVVMDEGELVEQPETVAPVVEHDELLEQSETVESVVEDNGEVLKQSETVEPVVEEHEELLQQSDSANSNESVSEHDGPLLKQSCVTEPVVEENAELVKESSSNDSVLEQNLEVLRQPETVAPVVDNAVELLKQCSNMESVPVLECNRESSIVANTEEPVVVDDGDGVILKQFSSADPVVEHDQELMSQCNNVEPVVEETVDILKPSVNVESVMEHDEELSKQSETVQQVVEVDGELLKQCEVVESVLEDGEELVKQPNSADSVNSVIKHDGVLLKQPETVEQVVEDREQLSKQCDNIEPVVKEGRELLNPCSNDELVLELDAEIVEQVVEDGGELLKQLDTHDSTVEHNMKILRQSDNYESFIAREREQVKQSQDDEMMKVASVVAEDVIEPTVTDTVENHADDVHVHTEAECNVHVLMPSVNVSDELVSATTSDLSLDVATEAVAAIGRQFCQSSVAQEPESKASIPVNVLVPECESEAVEVFAVPVSELVPRTDRSHTDELELMMPEEKEIAVSLDVTDAGMSLEDLEMRPSTDDSEAAVQLGMQVLDANIEAGVSTIGAVDPNGVEGAETVAQAAVCHVEQCDHKIDACCSDTTAPVDVHATSEDALAYTSVTYMADEDTAVCAVDSEDTAETGVMMVSAVDRDAVVSTVRSEDSVENSVMSPVVVRDAVVASEDKVEGETVISAAVKDTVVSATSSEDAVESTHVITAAVKDSLVHVSSDDAVQSEVMSSTANSTAALLASSEDVVETAAVCSNSSDTTVQDEVIVSVGDEDTAVHAQSSEDTVLSGVTISTAVKDTSTDMVGSEDLVHSEGKIPLADKDAVMHAVSLKDMTASRVTTSVAYEDTAAVVARSDNTLQRGVLTSTADKDMDVLGESSEKPVQSGVMISVTDNDKAVSVTGSEDTTQTGLMISMADAAADATMVVRDCGGVCDIAECKMTTVPTDTCAAVYHCQTDDVVTDAVSQFNSQTSYSSVEDGQFDDVESEDEPATPSNIHHRQLSRASSTSALRQSCHSAVRTTSLVSDIRRNVHGVSPSSFGLSPVRTSISRHSPNTFSVSNSNVMSTCVRPMPGCSPLLSSPVGQSVDIVGRPGTRPRFPQSPIISHTGAYPPGASLQIHDNSPRDTSLVVRNTAQASGGKIGKRKRSVDDEDGSSKRSLVAAFTGDSTAIVSQCDVVPAECAVISSACDSNSDATVTSATDVVGTASQADADGVGTSSQAAAAAAVVGKSSETAATDEKLQNQNEASIVTTLSQPVNSVLCSDCSAVTGDLDRQTIKSSEVIPEVIVHDEREVLIETKSSVVDSSPSHVADTATVESGLLINLRQNSDAEVSERLEMVEDIEQGFTSMNTNVSLDAEVVEHMRTNVAERSVECLTVNSNKDNFSSKSVEMESNFPTLVADVDEKVCGSQWNSSAEIVELAAEHSSGNRTVDNVMLSVTTSTCHDHCVGDCTEEQQEELLVHEVTREVLQSHSSIASNVETRSSDLRLDPETCVTDASRTDVELSDRVAIERVRVNAATSLLMENPCSIADSSQIAPSQLQADTPCFVKSPSNKLVTFCTRDDMFSDVQPRGSTSLKSELERCDFEVRASVTDTVVTDNFFASQCVSQADEIPASQATASSDVGDVFASQCISQTAKNEISAAHNDANTNSDVDGMHLFLEMSQEPSTLNTSRHSDFVSQAAKNEISAAHNDANTNSGVDGMHLFLEMSQEPSTLNTSRRSQFVSQTAKNEVTCSQTTCSLDVDGLYLYLEPSQEPRSLDTLNHNKSHFAEDVKRFETEDEVLTGGEDSFSTAGASDILMEHRDRSISSQSTAGGDQETAGEEEYASELNEDNYYGINVWKYDNELSHSLRQEHHHCESKLNTTLPSCEESEVQKQITYGEDASGFETKGTVDSISIESELTDTPCESAVFNSYEDVDESSTVERLALSVIVEEEETDQSVAERVNIDVDATSVVDKSMDSSVGEAVDFNANALSPVKCDAHTDIVGPAADDDDEDNDNDAITGDGVGLDVTESISDVDSNTDKYVDVTQSSEKDDICSPAKHDVHVVAPAANDDDNDDNSDDDGACIKESIPCCDSSTEQDADAAQLSEKADVCSAVKHDVDAVAATADNTNDEKEDEADGTDVTDSMSEVGNCTDKDVHLTPQSEKSGVCLPVKCDYPHAVAVGDDDDGNASDDGDGSDVTESISGDDSDVGRLSEIEENVQHQAEFYSNDNVSDLSPRSIQLLLNPASVGDMQPEESLAGEYCLILIILTLTFTIQNDNSFTVLAICNN